MTTFILKKYEQKESSPDEQNNQEINKEETGTEKELTIKVEGSVSEIIANALRHVLANKAVVQEIEDREEEKIDSSVKAIGTEDINTDPVKAYKSINSGDIVYIDNKGFRTAKEDWFLLNMPNKTENVFFSVESFIKYISSRLGV